MWFPHCSVWSQLHRASCGMQGNAIDRLNQPPPQFWGSSYLIILLYIYFQGRISKCLHINYAVSIPAPHSYKLVYAPAQPLHSTITKEIRIMTPASSPCRHLMITGQLITYRSIALAILGRTYGGVMAYNRRELASETERATHHTLKTSIRADTIC